MKRFLEEIMKYSGKPQIFEKGTSNFWDDPHISKYMLEAHLNPDGDAASRRFSTIDSTVKWINDNFLKDESQILDLGCGPGLYAERLARLGHRVVGIDFSKRSIEYAKESAKGNGLNIEYIYKNYIEMDYSEEFDLIILIFCDFGVLNNDDRDTLLGKIYKAIKPGGYFIFDVFSENFINEKKTNKNWKVYNSGFWSDNRHIVLSETFHYAEDKTFLDQYIVIDESNRFEVYRAYDRYYSEEDLHEVLRECNFKDPRFYYDIVKNGELSSVCFTTAEK